MKLIWQRNMFTNDSGDNKSDNNTGSLWTQILQSIFFTREQIRKVENINELDKQQQDATSHEVPTAATDPKKIRSLYIISYSPQYHNNSKNIIKKLFHMKNFINI